MNGHKTFILGIGAQKAGTTWLHHYISTAPNADTGSHKEYHIWDSTTRGGFNAKATVRVRDALSNRRKFMMQWSDRAYFGYFAQLLNRDGISITADITPTYCSLKQETFERIRSGFARRRIDSKAVFLMRDPVERCWSKVRHDVRKNRIGDRELSGEVLAYALSSDAVVRTRYDRTLQTALEAFTAKELHIGFYETMFASEEVKRLSQFVGVPYRAEIANEVVNATIRSGEITEQVMRKVAQHYRDVYEFVGERWPEIRSHWLGYRYIY
ncbi:MAG: sulfotransferase domain-containing protein [Hyphomicrobiales bacterium]